MQIQTKLDPVLTSAKALFIVPGFADTKMIDIAQAADIAVGTLYHLFRSKEDLLQAVFAVTLDPTILDNVTNLPITPQTTPDLIQATQRRYQQAATQLDRLMATNQQAGAFNRLTSYLFTTFDQFGAYFLILERNAQLNPQLVSLYKDYRQALYQNVAHYLTVLVSHGVVIPQLQPYYDAHLIIDEIFWWSAHKHYDAFERQANNFDPVLMKKTVMTQLARSYTMPA